MITRQSEGTSDSTDLWGRCLRHAALATLILAAAPLTVGQVMAGIEARGRRVAARYPRQALADALAYERATGRVVRVCRGTYTASRLPKTTRWRILTRYGRAPRSGSADEGLHDAGEGGGTGDGIERVGRAGQAGVL
ncbi:MAG TPA: hypothetical protein VGL32_04735, partial [Acidimicrobiales bacterium]